MGPSRWHAECWKVPQGETDSHGTPRQAGMGRDMPGTGTPGRPSGSAASPAAGRAEAGLPTLALALAQHDDEVVAHAVPHAGRAARCPPVPPPGELVFPSPSARPACTMGEAISAAGTAGE